MGLQHPYHRFESGCRLHFISCRRGGIGRRAGLKIPFLHGSVGSTPTAGILKGPACPLQKPVPSSELVFYVYLNSFKIQLVNLPTTMLYYLLSLRHFAGVAELADARDSKSRSFTGVSVRPRPPVLFLIVCQAIRLEALTMSQGFFLVCQAWQLSRW